ncbi:MAG: YicC family protein [Clostridia bacterium]|nr:YicC family protein [Clostridia bacterium]
MVKSMTGYGRGQAQAEGLEVTVEIKSVNHRYFDFSIRTPRGYSFIEEKMKAHVQQRATRGKIDVYVTVAASSDAPDIEVHEEFAGKYVAALKKLCELYGLRDDISVNTVSRNSDVFIMTASEQDEDKIWETVKQAANMALDSFVAMREAEGEKLAADVNGRLDFIKSKVEFIEKRSPETLRLYRERLEQKMRELLEERSIDEQRLLTETAIFADKIAVDEETVRLRSHMSQLEKMLASSDAIGRKIDFTVQEMNRETNTIGSKAQDIEIANAVVDIKAEIEKIREQIQNIE